MICNDYHRGRAGDRVPARRQTVTALANFFTRIVNRYMPDPLVVAILLTALTVLIAMLAQGT
ncbi:MAG TPA: hypothetical protein DEB47_22865, partial [Citreicella sp.]|nr:hypothetical protein [Citreicella sp.]